MNYWKYFEKDVIIIPILSIRLIDWNSFCLISCEEPLIGLCQPQETIWYRVTFGRWSCVDLDFDFCWNSRSWKNRWRARFVWGSTSNVRYLKLDDPQINTSQNRTHYSYCLFCLGGQHYLLMQCSTVHSEIATSLPSSGSMEIVVTSTRISLVIHLLFYKASQAPVNSAQPAQHCLQH